MVKCKTTIIIPFAIYTENNILFPYLMLYTSFFTSVCTDFLFILNIIHNIPLYPMTFLFILSGEKMLRNLSHGACLYLHNGRLEYMCSVCQSVSLFVFILTCD